MDAHAFADGGAGLATSGFADIGDTSETAFVPWVLQAWFTRGHHFANQFFFESGTSLA